MPARPRDFQRSRLYRWEAQHVIPRDRASLSLEACRLLVGRVFAERLGPAAPPPRVEDGRGRRHAAGSREVIKLPRWARTRPIVLHECAHGLATDAHGPDFVRVYVDLLAEFLQFDRAELEESLGRAGVKVSGQAKPIKRPAPPRRLATATVPRSLAMRLLSIGVRTLEDLRKLGAVQVWVRLRRQFGQIVRPDSVLLLESIGSARPVTELDGRKRAQLKFEATRQLIEAGRDRPSPGSGAH